MKSELDILGNVPVMTEAISSLYPQLAEKNNKVMELERKGLIIRLRRGLYVVNPEQNGVPLCLGLIANHIYAPSYVSMQSALRHYGLIPESVYSTQSMTFKLAKSYDTPVGHFTYTHADKAAFHIGLRIEREGGAAYVMATPEKALCDLVAHTPHLKLRYVKEARTYLEDDIRMDMDAFYKMDPEILRQYAKMGKKGDAVQTIIKLLLK